MESTRPIRALIRGLDALTVLNQRDGATVSEVAQEIRLPRTTVYRILETLCNAGFVFRDAADDRYRLTILVRSLSGGFDDDAWVTKIATPIIQELGRDIVWPLALATLSGTAMMVRDTTDHSTPLAVERYSAGFRMPVFGSAAGHAYLACCPSEERDALLEELRAAKHDGDEWAAAPRAELLRRLADIKVQGYASTTRARRLVEEISIGVPVTLDDRVLAVLVLRVAAAAIPIKSALERFLPKLMRAAATISTAFAEQQIAAHCA